MKRRGWALRFRIGDRVRIREQSFIITDKDVDNLSYTIRNDDEGIEETVFEEEVNQDE